MGKTVAIHTNLRLDHQREYAEHLKSGFEVHGYEVEVTADRTNQADIHVIQGPHYALHENLGKPTIFLDRCFWGHPRQVVSLAWLTHDGGKVWEAEAPGDREKPYLQPWRANQENALILNDYDREFPEQQAREHFVVVEVREHPARTKPLEALNDALERNHVAIGYLSTALVSAVVKGLPVICFDKRSPVYSMASHSLDEIVRPEREQWLNNLSYMNWSYAEIESGEALERLLCQLP